MKETNVVLLERRRAEALKIKNDKGIPHHWYTVHNANYGTVVSEFKNEMSYTEAVKLGKIECRKQGDIYIGTCSQDEVESLKKIALSQFPKAQ